MHTREEILGSFSRLLDVMDELREKCPWDKKQTFGSLRNNTVEEVFELRLSPKAISNRSKKSLATCCCTWFSMPVWVERQATST